MKKEPTKPNEQDAKILELTNDLQRTRADFENYRKQVELQRSQAVEITKEATARKFLPLLDNIELAISSYPEQLAPLAKSLEKTMTELGLARIESSVGTPFNPDYHDAISMEESVGEKEVISESLRTGYLYDGQIVRPAMVRVKKI